MNRTFVTFVAVGGFSAIFNWGSRFLFERVMNFGEAVIAAYLVGMAIAYTGNRLLVFEASKRSAWDEAGRFTLVNMMSLTIVWAVSLGLVRFIFPAAGFAWHPEAVAHALGLCSITFVSYFAHRYFTFAKVNAKATPAGEAPPTEEEHPREMHPLAVDMDGTLLRTDVLLEGIVQGLFRAPVRTLRALPLLARSRAAFKTAIAEISPLDIGVLPVCESLLDHLRGEQARGRPLYLVTAANQGVAERVADRFKLFKGVQGSSGAVNLKGARKAERLRALFPAGFAYAGDSRADLDVWRVSDSMLLAGASVGLARQARGMGKPLEGIFDTRTFKPRIWRKALRLHQWSKNVLIFMPVLLSRALHDPVAQWHCLIGFMLMGVAASGTYMINDLADLEADRRHRTKRFRPIASGDLPVVQALVAAPLMIGLAVLGAFVLMPIFGVTLLGYLALTLSYSLRLKRVALLDVMVLGGLYTLRLVAGTLLSQTVMSPWLLTFAFVFFFSMSLAKRHVEVSTASGPAEQELPGRGYRPADAPLTLSLGVATSAAAVTIIVQYMMAEAFPSDVYRLPVALWAAPVLLGLWICRIWLLAHRGQLADDPVAFAMKDRWSLVMGIFLGISFAAARLL